MASIEYIYDCTVKQNEESMCQLYSQIYRKLFLVSEAATAVLWWEQCLCSPVTHFNLCTHTCYYTIQMSNAQENEDKKSFITLLPATLESLCSMQGVPHDDTILHRLLDIIKQLSKSCWRCYFLLLLQQFKQQLTDLSIFTTATGDRITS